LFKENLGIMNANNERKNSTSSLSSAPKASFSGEEICVKKCQRFACLYQDCLNKQGVDKPDRCVAFINQWNECCDNVKANAPNESNKK
jgi:hypothetical protein